MKRTETIVFHLLHIAKVNYRNELIYLILLLIFITLCIIMLDKIKKLSNNVRTLSGIDPLTKLPNSNTLEKDINAIFKENPSPATSFIMIDFDNFSMINQYYGYSSGDVILIEAANRLSKFIHNTDQLYRFKGAEFVILCQCDMSKENISLYAQNILKVLTNYYELEGKLVELNFNIGICSCDASHTLCDPLKSVTQAKNYARYIGCNQIQHFDLETYKNIQRTLELQADITNGLLENQFHLVYQPLFYLNNQEIAEVEALIRWNHPKLGLLSPDQFIELSERTGRIISIDYWVLEAACRQLRNWKDENKKPILLSINISSKTFEMKSFITDLTEMIDKYGIDPSYLQLELTERMIIQNIIDCTQKLKELRKMGIRIAIDDFGIGYSSLSYIVNLPIDSIKIDKSFVQQVASSKEAETIVASIINLCKTLKLHVIAEGIEKRTELDYLLLRKCDIGQGYYFSKPLDINEIEALYI